MLSIGDPLVVGSSGKQKVVIIMRIFSGDNEIDHIPQANVTQSATKVEVRLLRMIENQDNLFWTGRYSSSSFRVSGGDCLSIEPQISLQPPEGCSSYYFNKQLIQDIGVHIVLSGQNNDTDEGTKCKICKRRVRLKDMRVHVGKHAIKNDITGEQDDLWILWQTWLHCIVRSNVSQRQQNVFLP